MSYDDDYEFVEEQNSISAEIERLTKEIQKAESKNDFTLVAELTAQRLYLLKSNI